jgi:phosphoribosylformimino-5-aminoimidazole carboxamide ribotide isomerase
MVRSVKIPLQLGGGLRRIEAIDQVLELGVERAILGTAAIEEPNLIREACRWFGERIIVSIDARDGYVATHGWRERTGVTAIELVERMASLGVRRFIYTDIARDGTLTEPNFRAIAQMVGKTNLPIIASGGISSLEHLKRLAELGVEGAIVGRALYTGDIDLGEALRCIQP